MAENENNNKFESRILEDLIDVVAVINHLQDNLSTGKPVVLIIKMMPRRKSEEDFCAIKEPAVQQIEVGDEKKISNIGKFLTENIFNARVHVAIEQNKPPSF
jgi:hypothetical protein